MGVLFQNDRVRLSVDFDFQVGTRRLHGKRKRFIDDFEPAGLAVFFVTGLDFKFFDLVADLAGGLHFGNARRFLGLFVGTVNVKNNKVVGIARKPLAIDPCVGEFKNVASLRPMPVVTMFVGMGIATLSTGDGLARLAVIGASGQKNETGNG